MKELAFLAEYGIFAENFGKISFIFDSYLIDFQNFKN
jgi:hypothetical protein